MFRRRRLESKAARPEVTTAVVIEGGAWHGFEQGTVLLIMSGYVAFWSPEDQHPYGDLWNDEDVDRLRRDPSIVTLPTAFTEFIREPVFGIE